MGSLRATTEFDTGTPPFRVLDVLLDIFEWVPNGDDANRIGVSLTEDSSETRDLVSLGERQLLGVDWCGLLDPIVRDVFDLDELSGVNRFVVGEVESEFGRCDQ